MAHDLRPDLTTLIEEARAGVLDARDRLVGAVYVELCRMAENLMRRERPDHTLEPCALVNEALLRMFDEDALAQATNRRYLFGAAAQAMRQVLVDHARHRNAAKGPGGRRKVPLDNVLAYFEAERVDVLALHEALDRLSALDERQGQVVMLRFFAGLSVAEVAAMLEVSKATVEGDWRVARAWLRGQLEGVAQ